MEVNSLRDIFYKHEGHLVHKWDHYFEIYERYFSKYRGQKLNILEIGISHGGSLQMWKKYFGNDINIYAIDVNPECRQFEDENTKIFIGSQSDPEFLEQVIKEMPDLDIIIDDGGHTMIQQKVSFEMLYMKVKEGGIYLVEDTHTSYWYKFHGGLRKKSTFIEYSKNLVDSLYRDHILEKEKLTINNITDHINCISFFDSIVVFEKLKRPSAFHIRKGKSVNGPYYPPELKDETLWMKIKGKIFGREKNEFISNDRGNLD